MSALARARPFVPATPRVISPSPSPSERESSEAGYDIPVTRSAARRGIIRPQPSAVMKELGELEELEDVDDMKGCFGRKARTRGRSPMHPVGRMKNAQVTECQTVNGLMKATIAAPVTTHGQIGREDGREDGDRHRLAVPTLFPYTGWDWRGLSRSPSPLGLIPIHRQWRTFVHKHEVPRKALHISIGFFVVWLYLAGVQTASVCPYLLTALIPIATADVLRHHYEPFNRFYVGVLGALMRESEFSGYNGVIFYLLGAFIVLNFFPKDVGVVGTLLLSWCDTAASTSGRLWGRYTPRLRRGKSLAGSTAAFLVGVGTSAWFWGWLVPGKGPFPGDEAFMFTGVLRLPAAVAETVGLDQAQAALSGRAALMVMSIWSGFMAAGSEVMDVFGWDDNLTIPVLSGLGIWGFLKIFG